MKLQSKFLETVSNYVWIRVPFESSWNFVNKILLRANYVNNFNVFIVLHITKAHNTTCNT